MMFEKCIECCSISVLLTPSSICVTCCCILVYKNDFLSSVVNDSLFMCLYVIIHYVFFILIVKQNNCNKYT